MKYFFVGFIALTGALIINIPSLSDAYINHSGVQKYKAGNFSGALDNFLQVQDQYNIAGSYYKQGDYQNALDLYSDISEKNQKLYHNLGNTHYFLAQRETSSLTSRIALLEKSILAYESAQALRYTDETQNNLDIVSKELEELKKALEQQDSESQQENENGSSEDGGESQESQEDSSSSNEEEGEGGSGETESGEEQESGENSGGASQESGGLSSEEQEAIESYKQKLEDAQGSYGQFYNKVYEESQSDLDRLFSNDPFFDNSLLEGEEKKDW